MEKLDETKRELFDHDRGPLDLRVLQYAQARTAIDLQGASNLLHETQPLCCSG